MDTVSIQSPKYPLSDKWDLYYHLPTDSKWDLESYTVILGDIHSVDQVIAINNAIPEEIVTNNMLFLMRTGVTPMWEDKQNRLGGCFSYKIINKQVYDIWKQLFYLCCGETLTTKKENHKHINGITISPKKHFCIIKIWLDTTEHQDPAFIRQLANLSIQGCIFKKHSPEF